MVEKSGAESGALPHLKPFKEQFYHCSTCNYCVEMTWGEWGIDGVCPTLRQHSSAQGYSGKGFIAAARAWSEGGLGDLESLAERAFSCTTCGNCDEICPIALSPRGIAIALRAELIERGLAPDWTEDRREALSSPPYLAVDLAEIPSDATAILCSPSQARSRDEAEAVAELLGPVRLVRVVETPLQDSAELAELGYGAQAAAQLGNLAARLAGSPTVTLLAVDIDGLALLGATAPDTCVESALSALLAALRDGEMVLVPREGVEPPEAVGYFDSCHMSKTAHGLGELDLAGQARTLLATLGVEVIAPETEAARFQICCGAAGGMPRAHPDAADRMASAAVCELERSGARMMLSASPLCASHLSLAREGGTSVQGLFRFLATYFEARPGRAA